MHPEDLDRLEQEALRTIRLKTDNARKGHDWVVDAHTLTSTTLLELVALAKLGWPVWREQDRTGHGVAPEPPADG